MRVSIIKKLISAVLCLFNHIRLAVTAFADESGALPADASNDGVHLNKSYCVQWLDYLKTHTVSYDTLYPEGAETE